MFIAVEVTADPPKDRRTRYLRALSELTASLLQVRPDHVRLTVSETDPRTRARNERQAAIARNSWTGC
ncbi:hypothetical protein ABZ897_57865 [Nonomuraea sp. NPDC046802]|uniref:hypothetical protein n=1 Tax=Nonomuraea sp. NPDC046802 TaxID=3154919 RepID=UPI00340CECBA